MMRVTFLLLCLLLIAFSNIIVSAVVSEPNFWIFTEFCTPGAKGIYFKTDLGPSYCPDCDFYLIYRAPWALFQWADIEMFGTSDTANMIDPIEDAFTHMDVGMYRWTEGDSILPVPDIAYDFFLDSLLGPSDSRGVCDADTNWFYTCVAVDSNETTGALIYSSPARPVGEFDQWLYPGTNFISYPVDIGDTTAKMMGQTLGAINAASSIWRFNASTQAWSRIAAIIFGSWVGNTPISPGEVFRVEHTLSPYPALWSAYSPGYLPYDADIPIHNLYAGDNYVMMPYQEYNILLRLNWDAYGLKYVRARDMLADIPCAISIWRWNPGTQTWIRIAFYFGDIPVGNAEIRPGLPYRVIANGSCIWPPY